MSKDGSSPAPGNSNVGYGRPPEATRFKKGVSGNPKGRPKGSLNLATVFTKTLREKVVINQHGKRRTITKLEAALKQLANKAASGEQRSIRMLMELAQDTEAKQNLAGSQEPVLSAADHEVLDDILKRFSKSKDEGPSSIKDDNGDPEFK